MILSVIEVSYSAITALSNPESPQYLDICDNCVNKACRPSKVSLYTRNNKLLDSFYVSELFIRRIRHNRRSIKSKQAYYACTNWWLDSYCLLRLSNLGSNNSYLHTEYRLTYSHLDLLRYYLRKVCMGAYPTRHLPNPTNFLYALFSSSVLLKLIP